MLRISLPLCAFSSRRLGREAVFLPWNARPWPTYDTHADEWKFLDRALSAVVEMSPQEVSEKSMRLCPRHLLHEIEDPVVALQQRRRRRTDGQRTQKSKQQQRRRKGEEEECMVAVVEKQRQKERSASAGLRTACITNDNRGASVGKVEGNRSANVENATLITRTTTTTTSGSSDSSSSSNNNNNRGRKKKDPLSSAHVKKPPPLPASATSADSVSCSPVAVVKDGTTGGRHHTAKVVATPLVVVKGSRRSSCSAGQIETNVLADSDKTDFDVAKRGGGGEKHVARGTTLDSKEIVDTACLPAKKPKQPRGNGKEGKRRGQSPGTTSSSSSTVAATGVASVPPAAAPTAAGVGRSLAGEETHTGW